MDGTLLGPDRTVERPNIEALARAATHGIEVVVATGRSHWSAIRLLSELPFIRWHLCSNGATVYDGHVGDVVTSRAIDPRVVEEAVMAVTAAFPEVGYAYETPEGIHYTETFVENRVLANPTVVVKDTVPEPDTIEGQPVIKLMVSHPEMVQIEWLDALVPVMPDGLHLSTSGSDFIEICAPGADKGLALAELCDALGVAAAEVASFGDHTNDVGMLTWAGRGYAMANAVDRALDVTDLRAPHHADHGVAEVVNGFLDAAGLE
jgi:Cof subfamily protein (haloacid dehalogenase superfamily)